MAAPKKEGFRLVSDYRGVNKQVEKDRVSCPTKRRKRSTCGSRHDLGSLRCCKDVGLAAGGRSPGSVTIATPEGLFTPAHVHQDVLNVAAYFTGVMTELLAGSTGEDW